MAATNGTRHPDRFEIAARTWAAKAETVEHARRITARFEAVSSAEAPHSLELVDPLADLERAHASDDDLAFTKACTRFFESLVNLKEAVVIA